MNSAETPFEAISLMPPTRWPPDVIVDESSSTWKLRYWTLGDELVSARIQFVICLLAGLVLLVVASSGKR